MNKATLNELCPDMHSGGTPSTKHDEYWGGDIPWLSSSETSKDYIDTANQFITQLGVDNSSTRFAEEGSVLIATAGQGKTRGQVSFLRIGAYINQSIIAMKPNEDLLHPQYLYYYLKNSYSQLRMLSDVSGVRGSLSGDLLRDFVISYPSVEYQKRVVDFLQTIDRKIEINNKICSTIEKAIKEVYDYYFIQFDFPNDNGDPYKFANGELMWNEKLNRNIPKSWAVKELRECCDFENGDRSDNYPSGKDFLSQGVPFVAGGAIVNGGIRKKEIRYISEEKYNSLRSGKARKEDVLMTLRGSLAKCVYSPYEELAIASALVIVRPKQPLSNYYIHSVLTSDYYTQLIRNYNNGSVQANLSVDSIGYFPVLIPDKKTIDKYNYCVEPFVKNYINYNSETQVLLSVREFLLPMLMNGQVKIKEK